MKGIWWLLTFYMIKINLIYTHKTNDNSLYNEFNEKLSDLTDYAKTNLLPVTIAELNTIVERTCELLHEHLHQVKRRNSNDKIFLDSEFEKLLNVLSPFYDKQPTNEKNFHQNDDTVASSSTINKFEWAKQNPGKFKRFLKLLHVKANIPTAKNMGQDDNLKYINNVNHKTDELNNINGSPLKNKCSNNMDCNKSYFDGLTYLKDKRELRLNPNQFFSQMDSMMDPKAIVSPNTRNVYPDVLTKSDPGPLANINKFLNSQNTLNIVGESQPTVTSNGNPMSQMVDLPPQEHRYPFNYMSSNFMNMNEGELQQERQELQHQLDLRNELMQRQIKPLPAVGIPLTPSSLGQCTTENGQFQQDSTAGVPLPTDIRKQIDSTQQRLDNVEALDQSSVNDCIKITDSTNSTAVLERILYELELIRMLKAGTITPDGTACDIMGSWNSQVIGLRFEITPSNTTKRDLIIRLGDHSPPKRVTLMDKSWTCTGFTLHRNGGPFYISAAKQKEEVLATFTGICKTCSGVDTIFGSWNIINPAKDCRDLQVSIETKRDIFRKDLFHRPIGLLNELNPAMGKQQQKDTENIKSFTKDDDKGKSDKDKGDIKSVGINIAATTSSPSSTPVCLQ